jgi:hypothetical protein
MEVTAPGYVMTYNCVCVILSCGVRIYCRNYLPAAMYPCCRWLGALWARVGVGSRYQCTI